LTVCDTATAAVSVRASVIAISLMRVDFMSPPGD
jgi:hypothetical protein